MLCLDSTDVIEGGASVDAVIDYTLHGLAGGTFTQLAAGVMNTTLTAVLYTAGAAISVVSIILVNKHTSAVNITLCLDPANGGNPRYLIPKTISLGAGYSLHTDGARITVLDANGVVISGLNVSDTAYGAGWNGITAVAPSKNAVYDEVELRTKAVAVIADNKLIGGDGGSRGVQERNVVVNDNGIVTMAGQSGCGVKLTSDQTITSSTWTKLVLATELWDTHNEFDNAANYRFTVGVAGKYLCIGVGATSSLPDGAAGVVEFRKNGVSFGAYAVVYVGGVGVLSLSIAAILNTAVNDYIELFLYHTKGSDGTAPAADGKNVMQIQKIG